MFSPGTTNSREKTVRLHLSGGAEHPALVGIDPLTTQSNYFKGSDPRARSTRLAPRRRELSDRL